MKRSEHMGQYIAERRVFSDKLKDIINILGIEHGDAVIMEVNKNYMAVKFKGRSYWASVGVQGYAPAEIVFYKILEEEKEGSIIKYRIERLLSFELRKKKE